MPATPTNQRPASPSYRVINPASGETVEEFPTITDGELQDAITTAENAFQSWRQVPMTERSRLIARVGKLFTERKDQLASIITEEMGKRLSESRSEVAFCTEIFNYYAIEGPKLAADQPIKALNGARAVIQKLPVGPLLGIMPWNYPYYQVARFAAPNLMLGNTIILKHAENCPRSAQAIQQIMADAGLPRGAYLNVSASHEQIGTIIADPRIQGVSLTGSERAGAAVAQIAGRSLKKVVLELGGSDPYIVLDSADVQASARAAFETRMSNAGQACNSNKRIIVMDTIYDEFVAELATQAAHLKPGNPAYEEPGTFVPLSSVTAAESLLSQIDDAVSKGAVLHAGGKPVDGPGSYLEPAVLTGITKDMRAYREELFGPVVVVYKVSSDQEAVTLANDSDYGLGSAVFSQDTNRAQSVAQQLNSGMATINAAEGEGPGMPFGGVKRSGYGRELGPLGMDEFVNKRLLYIAE
ncbi:NAD-dependent succinate-semialdehyde dehydrogenase [Paenarthrobacter sp. PH39-S1]|uniref:NAD-dependent succinate-semialdehyde dehydrogenase n=1 Tax=Paenarthrobacter sp. PH39-S1 TaxID=3046204 RepID=UPI0024BAA0F7|nr:NAD-dependent succinate-semialdehyde dehydrogenase [Paenarthrobacter sp. PH39-S1]MDJ0358245.1 NAD-dependent succinate-semialdehyde dehydrogenase [Paenarthrobacter sp. PH39-S1]